MPSRLNFSGGRRDPSRPVKQSDLEVLPSMDNPRYYDPPSPTSSTSSVEERHEHLVTNSGHKVEQEARWIRKGKMCAWGPSYDEAQRRQRSRKRLQTCLEEILPEAAAEVGAEPPENIVKAEERRQLRKRRKVEDKECLLPHLRSPSPPLSTLDLAPMLALPRSYLDIVTSPAMRHSLGDDSMERGLQKTAADLIECEKPLLQALGRLREVLRLRKRDVPDEENRPSDPPAEPVANGSHTVSNGDGAEENGTTANGHGDSSATANKDQIPPLPHVSETDNLWRVTQELLQTQPPPALSYTVTPPGAGASSNTEPAYLTPIHKLFTCPSGITFNAVPNQNHPGFVQLSRMHPLYPRHVKYNLDMANQQRAVDDALERVNELLADCNEYKERLEEARERVADVARARKAVWKVIQRRAGRELDRMEGKTT